MLWRKGCGYPIDLMTEEDQDHYFWNCLSPLNGYCVSIFDKNKKLKDCYSNQKDFIFSKIIAVAKKESNTLVKEEINFILIQNGINC